MDNIHTQKLMNEKNELMRELLKTQKQLNEMRQQVQQYQALVASMQETYNMPPDRKPINNTNTLNTNDKKHIQGPEGNKPQERNSLYPKNIRLRESHTLKRLQKMSKDGLEKLKTKYTNKLKTATGDDAKHHRKELKDIGGLLAKKKVNEELLNEIGDTPAGQRALKKTLSRARAQIDLDKTIGLNFANRFGTPAEVEEVNKRITGKQKVIKQVQKRLDPKDLSAEAVRLRIQQQNAQLSEQVKQYETLLASLDEGMIPSQIRLGGGSIDQAGKKSFVARHGRKLTASEQLALVRHAQNVSKANQLIAGSKPQPPKSKELEGHTQQRSSTKRPVGKPISETAQLDEIITPEEARGSRRALALHQAQRVQKIVKAHNLASRQGFEEMRADALAAGRNFTQQEVDAQRGRGDRVARLAKRVGANVTTHVGAAGTVHEVGAGMNYTKNPNGNLKFFALPASQQQAAVDASQRERTERLTKRRGPDTSAFGF